MITILPLLLINNIYCCLFDTQSWSLIILIMAGPSFRHIEFLTMLFVIKHNVFFIATNWNAY